MTTKSAIPTLFSKFNVTESDAIKIIDGVPYMKDTALGEMIEFARPLKIKELIQRHIKAENINDFRVIPTVGKTPELGGRPSDTYYLSEADSLFIVSKSETAKGAMVLKRLIQFWLELRDKAGEFSRINEERIQKLEAEKEALKDRVFKSNALWNNLSRYKTMGLTMAEIVKLVGLHERTVRRHLQNMRECGVLYAVPAPRPAGHINNQLTLWS